MAHLEEILAQKEMLDRKIKEIKDILKTHQTDALADELVKLLEQRQHTLINIHRANVASKLKLGGNDIDITTAVIIRDTIGEKVNYLTELIENPECTLDKLELMKQRDRHFEEYTLISMGVQRNDLNVTLG